MTLSELRKKPHISASSISTYIDCSLSYKFSYIDHVKTEGTADALVFGSVMHRIIEFFQHERSKGEIPSIRELHNLFDECWRQAAEGNDDIQYKKGKDFESYLIEGKSLLTTYHSGLPDDGFHVIAIEEPFKFKIPGIPVPLVGQIDLIEEDDSGAIIVTDFKTAGRAYSNRDVDDNFQLTIYGMAIKANGFSDRLVLMKFDVLVKTITPKFLQYYTTRDLEDEKRAIKKIQAVWEGINKGVFIPNDTSWRCPGCSFKQHCNEYLLK